MPKDSTITIFRSTTASAVPGASALAAGELAVNLTDKKLFVGDAAGTSYHELTRRAAAASSAGFLTIQMADTNGYLTGPPSGILYWDTANERLTATAMQFGSVNFYASGSERIMEATGNPSRRIHIRQESGGEIHIGDSGLLGNTSIGLSVQENNNSIISYGDFYMEPDSNANTLGEIFARRINIRSANELRFKDSDNTNYVGFKAPSVVSADKIWTLPAADGTSGQVLSTNGSGTLSWVTAGGGGGSGTVTSITPAADSGSGTAITTSGTITISGTADETETSVSGTTVTVGVTDGISTGAVGGILSLFTQGII